MDLHRTSDVRKRRRSLRPGGLGVVLVLMACAPASASAALVVDAGPLDARVGTDPWRLELTGPTGETVLAEHPGRDAGPSGALGFRTAAGWQHATEVVDSSGGTDRWEATLATTDPLRTIELTLSRAGSGVIRLDASLVGPAAGVEAVGMGFVAPAGERYLGFGERSNSVDQTGGTVESYVADGPYQSEEYPFLAGFVPPWGLRDGRADATYFPIPWLLSSAGYGVLVDNPETSYFRLRSSSDDAWSAEVVKAPAGEAGAELAPPPTRLRMRFFAGPRPAGALRRFSRTVGRQPRPAAPWVFGPWYQAGDAAAELEALRQADAPVSVLQTYTHYLPCGAQNPPAERDRVATAHRAGVAITTYFNPMVCTNYQAAYGPASEADALTENALGQPYVYRYGADVDDLFVVGQYDFFERAGRELYASRLAEAVSHGYDGWMEDFGEYTPLDSVSAESIPGTRAHNPYAERYHCAAWRAVREESRPIVRFQRSGFTGAARCAQVVWGGDPTTGWGFDGLRSALTQALSAGLSGIGIWGSDIGGFFALGQNELTPELLTRWVQLGAASGVMRTQRNGVAVPPRDRPQVTDPDQLDNWRRYAKLRTQLYPYLNAAAKAYHRRGLPLMRHLLLAHPRDPRAARSSDQYLLGPDLLVAPVLDEGARERQVYLPRGRWIDLWRSASYEKRHGSLKLSRARVLRGPERTTVPAPLDELPLLVRAGSVLPLLPPGVDTLAPFRADGVVRLRDRQARIDLLALPRGARRGAIGMGGTLRSVATRRSWQLAIRAPRPTRFRLQAALLSIAPGFHPCRIALSGTPIPPRHWRFDRESGVLRASFRARRAELTVTRCAGD